MRPHALALTLLLVAAAQDAAAVDLARGRTIAGSGLTGGSITFQAPRPAPGAPVEIRSYAPGWSFQANAERMRLAVGQDLLEMRLERANADAKPLPLVPAGQVSQYFLGRGLGASGIVSPHYRRFRFQGVYAGIDLEYYANNGDIEYDFLLAPGASPASIILAFDRPVRVASDGSLSIPTGAGELRQHAPQAFQGEAAVPVRYRSLDDRTIGFQAGPYDPDLPLRIDPRIGLASFLGGVGADRIAGLAFDSRGAMWVVGQTNSPDFPLPPNGFPSPRRGASDVFASKLERQVDSAGAETWRLVSTLFLGGSSRERAVGIDVDAQGRVYVFGDTQSRDFPISNNAGQRDLAGGTDAFVTVLRETDFPFFTLGDEVGQPHQGAFTNYEIEYSTLIGGSGEDAAAHGDLAPFSEDPAVPCAILAGQSSSSDLPTTVFASQEKNAGGTDAFFSVLCRQAGQGYPLTYGTFLGGNREEVGGSMAVAASGAFCLATRTTSAGLPASGLQRVLRGSTEGYLACFAPVRRRLGLPFLYRELGRTFWGGSGADSLLDIAIQQTGGGAEEFRVFALAESVSSDIPQPFPVPPIPTGAAPANPGSRSLLVAAFTPALDRALTQFWLGGSSQESGAGLEIAGDCVAVAGKTASADFPQSQGFPERPPGSREDVAAGKFCFDAQMTSATTVYLGAHGSTGDDSATAIVAGPFDDEVIAGWTGNPGGAPPALAATASAPQPAFAGGLEDGFLIELYRPRLRAEAVVGAADFLARPLAPGQIVTLFGQGIGPGALIGPRLSAPARLADELGGVRVLFDGVAAPMIFVSRNQVSAVAPFFLETRSSVQVQIETDGAVSAPVTLPAAPATPAVFTLSQRGAGQVAALNEDSSINGESRPAAPGSLIQIFLTGAGQTLPGGVDGELIPVRQPFPRIVAPVAVRIGGAEAAVLYAGGAPGQVHGVAQINAVTPRGLPANPRTPLEIVIGGLPIQPGATVAVAGTP